MMNERWRNINWWGLKKTVGTKYIEVSPQIFISWENYRIVYGQQFIHRIHTQKRRVAFSCTPFGLSYDFLHGFCCIATSPCCECLFTNVPEVPVGEPHLAKV